MRRMLVTTLTKFSEGGVLCYAHEYFLLLPSLRRCLMPRRLLFFGLALVIIVGSCMSCGGDKNTPASSHTSDPSPAATDPGPDPTAPPVALPHDTPPLPTFPRVPAPAPPPTSTPSPVTPPAPP